MSGQVPIARNTIIEHFTIVFNGLILWIGGTIVGALHTPIRPSQRTH